jgi:hypothetical protein
MLITPGLSGLFLPGCCAFSAPAEKSFRYGKYVRLSTDVRGESGIASSHCIFEAFCVSGRAVSFQITVLKVLAGHPEGRASLADLRRAVAILISSGTDWTNRTKRLAARAPDLDIFSQSFVVRDNAGWQITDAGRAFLTSIETPVPMMANSEQAPEVVATSVPLPPSPPIRLLGVNRRRPRRRAAGRTRPPAAA